jgi:hypothetical protein
MHVSSANPIDFVVFYRYTRVKDKKGTIGVVMVEVKRDVLVVSVEKNSVLVCGFWRNPPFVIS